MQSPLFRMLLLICCFVNQCLAGGRGSRHYGSYLREDGADAGGNARHDRAGGYCNEASHQRVFDEVLTAGVFLQVQNQVRELFHVIVLSLQVLGKTNLQMDSTTGSAGSRISANPKNLR